MVPGFGFPHHGHSGRLPYLSAEAQACFRRWNERHLQQLATEEAALRVAIEGTQPELFAQLVDDLVPGRGGASRAHSILLLWSILRP